jgi:hypothetical protein
LTVTASTVSGNSARSGGGVLNEQGTLTVTSSTLSSNSASGSQTAGGIANTGSYANATVQLLNCTLSGNTATSADQTGNQLFSRVLSGTGRTDIQFRNSIIAGDGNRPDFFSLDGGTFTSGGHNLIRDGSGGSSFADTDLVGTAAFPIDPMLEPLGDYGGPTQTMRPLPGSPVINTGDNTDAPNTDQRGFPRIVLGFIDIGAVELQPDEFSGPSGSTAAQQVLGWLSDGATKTTRNSASASTVSAAEEKSIPADRSRLDAFFGLPDVSSQDEANGPGVLPNLGSRQAGELRSIRSNPSQTGADEDVLATSLYEGVSL